MGQDQAGFDVECVQQLGCLAVVEVVETSPKRLPIQRDAAPRWIGCGIPQTSGVAAEHPLDSLCVEALEDIANGGMGGRTLPAQTEGGVQPPAMHFDEGLNGAEGIATGDHGEDGEQQNIGQLVYLAFGSTRVGNLAEHREETDRTIAWQPAGDLAARHRFRDFAAPESGNGGRLACFGPTVAPQTHPSHSDV